MGHDAAMSFKILDLGRFSLVNTAESLKLDVVSAADFRGPRSIKDLDADVLLRALTSRQLWVSRGRGCRIDIEVLLDRKPLNRNDCVQFLESLGCQIRDAKVRIQRSSVEVVLILRSNGANSYSRHHWNYCRRSLTNEYPISQST